MLILRQITPRIKGVLKRVILNLNPEYRKEKHRIKEANLIAEEIEGYKINSPIETSSNLHETLILPKARSSFRHRYYNYFNSLFWLSFFVRGQRTANETSYNKWIQDFATLCIKSGKKASKIGPQPHRFIRRKTYKLAFTSIGDDPSAYDHIFYICKYLSENTSSQFEPTLFVMSYDNNADKLKALFKKINVRVYSLPFDHNAIVDSCLSLKKAMTDEKVDISIWIHLPTIPLYLLGLKAAPLQIYFSQYLHPDFKKYRFDGCLTYGAVTNKTKKFLKDRNWRVIPSSLKIKKKEQGDTQELREKYADQNTLLLASLGRIEKINQPDFINVVIETLKAHPQTKFLYTGYEDDKDLRHLFQKNNLDDRAIFVGWVDIDAYIQIIDIVLDSFPLANGITALKAMKYGTPILSMDTPYSFGGRDISPIAHEDFNGFSAAKETYGIIKKKIESLETLPFAKDSHDYKKQLSKLITDKSYRDDVSDFYRFCSDHLYENTSLMGKVFEEQLNEIIEGKL